MRVKCRVAASAEPHQSTPSDEAGGDGDGEGQEGVGCSSTTREEPTRAPGGGRGCVTRVCRRGCGAIRVSYASRMLWETIRFTPT
ncbi:hypothetical protein E2C01_080192 [Portunus trituberculatus]|uniref:Uncharacterized protein n=1 Tax=Portunus trituberculatus TaxID=210409 RepID=A0A5B7ITD9_PORTR|nr:hypothetical protein [Portunus trituberculatus]